MRVVKQPAASSQQPVVSICTSYAPVVAGALDNHFRPVCVGGSAKTIECAVTEPPQRCVQQLPLFLQWEQREERQATPKKRGGNPAKQCLYLATMDTWRPISSDASVPIPVMRRNNPANAHVDRTMFGNVQTHAQGGT